MIVSMTYYGVTMNAGNMGGDFYLNFFLMALVEIPGISIAMVMLDRLGRRWSNAGSMIVGGLACLLTIPTALLGHSSMCMVLWPGMLIIKRILAHFIRQCMATQS